MKTKFTRLSLLYTLFLFSILPGFLRAQVLEEVPNPPDYSLSWFNGGTGDHLFFSYYDINFNTNLFDYDGVDLTEVTIPLGNISFLFYSHSYADKDYIVVYDVNFNAILFEYDGETAVELEFPEGSTFGNYVTTYNDLMYFTLFDSNFNTTLYQYNGQAMAPVEGPADLNYTNFITEYEETLWLTFNDPNTFETLLFAFDGTAFSPISGLPTEVSFMFLAFENETDLYLSVSDQNFNAELYQFDGATFELIPTPEGLSFSYISGENADADELYINYFDNATFNNVLFIYDGLNLNEIPMPPGFDFPGLVSVFNGFSYFSLFDDISFNGALFKLDTGVLGQVDIPNNGNYSNHADTLLGEDYHIVYDQNFNFGLFKLDEENNALVEVEGPGGGLMFNNFSTVVSEKMLLNYVDANFYGTLFLYDGIEFTEIPNPEGKFYSFYMTEQEGKVYLRYDEFDTFLGTLYVLTPNSLPTSLDNTVTTDINIPYFFQASDFAFADTDANDSLSAIMITEIEQVGYLLWNGAHVYEGDIIPVDELEDLIFTPLQDEMGAPYDAFRFRVGDGESFSEVDYLMQINVQDPATSTRENSLNAFVRVAPVPAVHFTTIQLETNEAIGDLRLYVFNTTGQILLQQDHPHVGNSFNETIALSDWPAGTYYVIGRTDLGNFSKPLLIQR